MIEFDGYISGAAEKRFYSKSWEIVPFGLLCAALVVTPMVVYISYRMQSWMPMVGYCIIFALIPISLCIPKSKKEKLAMLPKRIYIEEDHIVCIAEKYSESKLIQDVKRVIDHGEFYELSFPFGKFSEKFMCQKSLLSKGTLEEFEALFEGKIVRRKQKS